jgi:hypothetical protein
MISPAHLFFRALSRTATPRGFSVCAAAFQLAVFALPGYTVHLTDPQCARFSFDAEQ